MRHRGLFRELRIHVSDFVLPGAPSSRCGRRNFKTFSVRGNSLATFDDWERDLLTEPCRRVIPVCLSLVGTWGVCVAGSYGILKNIRAGPSNGVVDGGVPDLRFSPGRGDEGHQSGADTNRTTMVSCRSRFLRLSFGSSRTSFCPQIFSTTLTHEALNLLILD